MTIEKLQQAKEMHAEIVNNDTKQMLLSEAVKRVNANALDIMEGDFDAIMVYFHRVAPVWFEMLTEKMKKGLVAIKSEYETDFSDL